MTGPIGQLSMLEGPEGVTRRHCGDCGAAFEPYSRADGYQKYCSHTCRQRAWKREQSVQNSDKGPTRGERILARLRRGPATGIELLQAGGGTRYGARVLELRQRGYEIETDRGGDWPVYRLRSEGEA